MRIKSKIDVITNSSTEVFILQISSPEYQELPEDLKKVFTEFNTLQDIRNIVEDENYYGNIIPEAQSLHGEIPWYLDPYSPEHREILEGSGLSKDELWEIFGKEYSGLLGHALYSRETDCGGDDISEAILDVQAEIYVRRYKEKLDQYPAGTILAIPLDNDYFGVGKEFPVLVKYSGNYIIKNPYCRSWKKLEGHPGFKDGFISEKMFGIQFMCDFLNIREATEEEKDEYQK